MTLKLGMQHRVLEYYQFYSNDDPGLTLTYFTARSNLVPYTFVWERGKTMDPSETIVIYDLTLATDDRSDKKFLFTSKLCPLGAVYFFPGAIYMYQDGYWSAKSQGNMIFLQGQGKSQGILQIGQGNFEYQESQGKVREFHNSGPKYVL